MLSDITLAFSVILIAYLLGSIPSAYIVGRLLKGLDMREVGDGHMGAAATWRRVGFWGMTLVGLMDVSKGVVAVLVSQNIGLPLMVTLLAGISAVTGHNWSIFLRFKGGKGALTTYGVLISLIFWEFFIAVALAGISYFTIHKTGMSTGVLLGSLSVINWVTGNSVLLSIFPILISLPMVFKHIAITKAGAMTVAAIETISNEEGQATSHSK